MEVFGVAFLFLCFSGLLFALRGADSQPAVHGLHTIRADNYLEIENDNRYIR
jgi:hypothetical protein